MSDTNTMELRDIDPDEISFVLQKIEKSFGFTFGHTELKDVKTFGELSDIITHKVQGDNANDCTTQQGFYKLRNAIAETLLIDKITLTPKTDLQQLFPRRNRRSRIAETEALLGFKAKILRPKYWITTTLLLISLISFIWLFISWELGLLGILVSILGLQLSDSLGNELSFQTVGQVADKISREHYLRARRNPKTINRIEIEKKVRELFINELDLEDTMLTRQATFV